MEPDTNNEQGSASAPIAQEAPDKTEQKPQDQDQATTQPLQSPPQPLKKSKKKMIIVSAIIAILIVILIICCFVFLPNNQSTTSNKSVSTTKKESTLDSNVEAATDILTGITASESDFKTDDSNAATDASTSANTVGGLINENSF